MLSIVPTPIGHLKDITLRALETLREADCIVCEDTRRTQTLLTHYEIKKPLVSFHDHSPKGKENEILARLETGEKVALVTDSGTPLLSDPGFPLVREVIRRGLALEVLPGAFAAATALVASGLPAESFSFLGFLPPKTAARQNKLRACEAREETLIFYESPFRLVKLLQDMLAVLEDREACVARELTKKFEEVKRGRLSDLIAYFSAKEVKGEIVVLVAGKGRKSVLNGV
ncbi:MAG: 16S rRNA (cytidine(1402)-2'-O)-methyltransferase [Candidatus Omnitrophota bacterium]